MKDVTILGIETSCDETAAAVVKNGREVLSNVINSQIDIHKKFGGVVPEIASRKHIEAISVVVGEALEKAKMTFDDIDAVACTYGPGLVRSTFSRSWICKSIKLSDFGKPLIPVNHTAGHIAANYITYKELEPEFLCLIISGGHTHLVKIEDYTKFQILGKTKDDAIGEAFDKVARVMNLEYPGGPKIDELAKKGKTNIELPNVHTDELNFSFSGIKTAVINLNHNKKDIKKEDLCASFEKKVTEVLIENTKKAIKQTNLKKVALAGGVSANSYIREKFLELGKELEIDIYFPRKDLCTDNAVMIASSGYYEYLAGNIADLSLNAVPNLKI